MCASKDKCHVAYILIKKQLILYPNRYNGLFVWLLSMLSFLFFLAREEQRTEKAVQIKESVKEPRTLE